MSDGRFASDRERIQPIDMYPAYRGVILLSPSMYSRAFDRMPSAPIKMSPLSQ